MLFPVFGKIERIARLIQVYSEEKQEIILDNINKKSKKATTFILSWAIGMLSLLFFLLLYINEKIRPVENWRLVGIGVGVLILIGLFINNLRS